jgi:hypothetical protein
VAGLVVPALARVSFPNACHSAAIWQGKTGLNAGRNALTCADGSLSDQAQGTVLRIDQ